MHTHGGPTACQLATFQPEAQAWIDQGFAWLSINSHGSTGFGKAWESSIYGQLGVLEVVRSHTDTIGRRTLRPARPDSWLFCCDTCLNSAIQSY